MQLSLSTWPEIDAYLQRSRGVIVPIGSIEQHGPTGLIGTDAICVEEIAGRAGRVADILIAPVMPAGVAPHHMAFAGTLSLRPDTFIAMVSDLTRSLVKHGFNRIYFLNGHGGNIAPLHQAMRGLKAEWGPDSGGEGGIACRVQSWWQYENVSALFRQLYPEGHGSHATPSEVAITQYVYPETMKTGPLEPRIAPVGQFTGPEDYRERFPDGRIGSDPAQASPEDGERLMNAAVNGLIADYRQFLESG